MIAECRSVAADWEQLSGYLGLLMSQIDTIKEDFSNNSVGCWNEALKQWIRQNYNTSKFQLPCWKMLLKAIAQVDKLLFKKLAEKHPLKTKISQ